MNYKILALYHFILKHNRRVWQTNTKNGHLFKIEFSPLLDMWQRTIWLEK